MAMTDRIGQAARGQNPPRAVGLIQDGQEGRLDGVERWRERTDDPEQGWNKVKPARNERP